MPQYAEKASARFEPCNLFGIDDLAIAAVGGSLISALSGSSASKKAAAASQAATESTNATNKAIYDTTRADLSPYNQAGQVANAALMKRYGLSAPTSTAPIGNAYAGAGSAYAMPAVSQSYLSANPDLVAEGNKQVQNGTFPDMPSYLAWHSAQPQYSNEGRGDWQAPAAPAQQTEMGTNAYAAAGTGSAGAEPGTFGDTANPSYQAPAAFSYGASDYTASPGYEWQLQQGLGAIQSSQAARGALYSGATMKALTKYAQGLAAQDFSAERGNAYQQYTDSANRSRANYDADRNYLTGQYNTNTGVLQNLASSGQNAAAQVGNAGANYAANAGNAYASNAATIGNAALANSANVSGLISSGLNAYAYSQRPGVVNSLASGGAIPSTLPKANSAGNAYSNYGWA